MFATLTKQDQKRVILRIPNHETQVSTPRDLLHSLEMDPIPYDSIPTFKIIRGDDLGLHFDPPHGSVATHQRPGYQISFKAKYGEPNEESSPRFHRDRESDSASLRSIPATTFGWKLRYFKYPYSTSQALEEPNSRTYHNTPAASQREVSIHCQEAAESG